ncbi:preprotein translocase subunit SecG [Seonamhaeicola marinus]|uniref:Protein-export membrane protein SecG n=1 Tax=Seonamhaeicola marinus TaxID=1912246 RepID=A0A5D0HZF8_9FLAO|nr:preprotein translocase subunit SecG [Seonamhaeicola marinus]TYA74882.1 preprotein translocase subunit SecG [Seonamhaeicola marinus]
MSFTIFLILIVVVAFLLIVVIMVQNPKGGGLSSSFGGGGTQQLGGVKKTTDFLDKSTWYLATFLLILILASNVAIKGGDTAVESKALDAEAAEQFQSLPDAQPLPGNADNTTATDSTAK